MKKIVFKHYKTNELIEIKFLGSIDNPQSDRLVVFDEEKKEYMDILKNTIVEITDV